MRYFEIILKLIFLANAIYLLIIKDVESIFFQIFALVCFVLGIVLMFNKKSSYNYPQTKKDFVMRQIEGSLLVIFAAVVIVVIKFS